MEIKRRLFHRLQEAQSKNLQCVGGFRHPDMSKLPQTSPVQPGTTPGRQELGTVALPRPFSRASSSAHTAPSAFIPRSSDAPAPGQWKRQNGKVQRFLFVRNR